MLTLVLVLMGGSEKLLLVRESFVTFSVGLIFLGSLLGPRPLMYHLAMRFTAGNSEADRLTFSRRWSIAYLRKVMRIMNAMWGTVFLLEAGVRTFLVFTLSTSEFLMLSNVVLYGFVGFLILWTVVYRRRASHRLNQIQV